MPEAMRQAGDRRPAQAALTEPALTEPAPIEAALTQATLTQATLTPATLTEAAPIEAAPTRPPSIEERLAAAGLPPVRRQAWLEVDLDALAANAAAIRALLPPRAALAIVVKADGYGHGMVGVARAAVRYGAAALVVATLDEALVLRAAGIGAPIVVLYPVPASGLAAAAEAGLDIAVADDASAAALAAALGAGLAARSRSGVAGGIGEAATPAARGVAVHLAVDSGMGRGGFRPAEVAAVARRLLDAGLAGLAGTWSHLASPEDRASVAAQVDRFDAALAGLREAGIEPGLRHLDATGGLLARGGPAYDMVRLGIGWYGVIPPDIGDADAEADAEAGGARLLRPALTLRARAASLALVPAGAAVGYGGTWTAARPTLVATLPIGYADGWARVYAAAGWGVARGRRVPIIGRISSDALALDVTDVPGFGSADEVVLLGRPDAAPGLDLVADGAAPGDPTAVPMTVHDLAALRGTIAWEVLDAFGGRLARIYLEGGRPVGLRALDGVTHWTEEFGAGAAASAPPTSVPPPSGTRSDRRRRGATPTGGGGTPRRLLER